MSLVEVLAALAMIAVVAPALGRVWVLSMTLAGKSASEITAATLAENRLAEIVAAGDAAGLELSDTFDEPHQRYRWQCTRSPWSGDSRLVQIDVTVTWTDRGRPRQVIVSTLVEDTDG
ncbi:MAG: hypothetical protein GX591_07965 [Planctomycetes bacterium]|nr:hypothetical protein [Planctomycetota bacterium]